MGWVVLLVCEERVFLHLLVLVLVFVYGLADCTMDGS